MDFTDLSKMNLEDIAIEARDNDWNDSQLAMAIQYKIAESLEKIAFKTEDE